MGANGLHYSYSSFILDFAAICRLLLLGESFLTESLDCRMVKKEKRKEAKENEEKEEEKDEEPIWPS